MERYADLLDLAQAHVERETALRIASIQLRVRRSGGRDHCIDCAARIPEARRRQVPNAIRCASCQDQAERGSARALSRG